MAGRMSLERTRVPDLSIGATVLIVAIALPFFVFTRAEHLHRANAQNGLTPSATTLLQGVGPTSDPSNDPPSTPGGSPSAKVLPLTATSPSSRARATTSARPRAAPTSKPAATPTSTPSLGPDLPPTPALTLSTNSGAAPLDVTADASGSSDTDQTPIAQIFFDFGDGSGAIVANSAGTATHTYSSPGTYIVTVSVIDTAKNAATATVTVTVS
jgi:PKD domain